MSLAMSDEGLPSPSLLGAVLRWRAGLRPGETMPALSCEARGVQPQLGPWAALCGYPEASKLPLCAPQVWAAPLHLAIFAHARFPLAVAGLVHVEQTILQRRPLRGDETVTLRARLGGVRPARKGGTFDLHTQVEVSGEVPWEGVSTIFSRALPAAGGPRPEAPAAEPLPEAMQLEAPADIGRRYAAVSGDRNPIHLHPWLARPFGFAGAIAHGMWTLARGLALLGSATPEAGRLRASFHAPVVLPAALTLRWGTSTEGLRFRVEGARPHLSGALEPLHGPPGGLPAAERNTPPP